MLKKLLVSVMVCLVFSGCEDDLNLKIRYDQIQGLKQDARVIFEENTIGVVTKVSYTREGAYLADVVIKMPFAKAATAHSKFFIVTDPQNEKEKAIEMIVSTKGGTPLQDGVTVKGSLRTSAFFDQLGEQLDKGIEGVKKQFGKFLEDLNQVPESEELKKLEKDMNRLGEELRRSGESVRERLLKEVVPQLRQELETLRKRLREFGREQELNPLEDKMDEIEKT